MNKKISISLIIILIVLSLTQSFILAAESESNISEMGQDESLECYFGDLNDPDMLRFVEDNLYLRVTQQLGNEYIVDDVNAVFVSKEYLEEIEYNSRSNIFFGYALDELDKAFEGERYVFTLGSSGETTVKAFKEYDDSFDRVIKNVAIGSGVILICVTISAATAGAGLPAASMIFAASAKSGAIFAVSSGALSGVIAGTVTGLQTHNMDEAIKAAALAGSDSFKWGAITGAVTGGTFKALSLKIASSGGLTANEAAVIIKNEKVSAQFLKQIKNMDEYKIICDTCKKMNWTVKQFSDYCLKYKYPVAIVEMFRNGTEASIYSDQASLFAKTVGGRQALIRNIDLAYESTLNDGTVVTNLERMRLGYAPLEPATQKAYELHHIGQTVDSPLAILTNAEHHLSENYAALHDIGIADGQGVQALLGSKWSLQKKAFWISLAQIVG